MTLVLFSILKISHTANPFLWDFTFFDCIFILRIDQKKNSQRKEKTNKKRWLFEEIIHQYGILPESLFPFHIFVQIFNHADDFLEMIIDTR
jgi:hypothetical protein